MTNYATISFTTVTVSSFVSHIRSKMRFTTLLIPLLFAGCRFYTASAPMAQYYYINPDKDLSAIGRTALVELNNESTYPQISADVTKALFQALQKKQVFGLTLVHQSDQQWRSLQLDLNPASPPNVPPAFTLEQLIAIRKALKCDAVLLGSVTEYQPFPHMTIGLRLKLIDLNDGQLLWALEQIWDTADKKTEYAIKNYFQCQIRSGFAPLREQLANVSSINFIKFVAFEVAETLKTDW